MKRLIVVAMFLCFMIAPVAAQEIAPAPVEVKVEQPVVAPVAAPVELPVKAEPAPAKAEAPEPVEPADKLSFLNPALWEIIAGIIAIIYAAIKTYFKLSNSKYAKVIEIIETAVRDVYVEFVRSAKAKHADGKLTTDEIKQALHDAWIKALELGKIQGVDITVYVTERYFPVIVDKIIKMLKKD